MRPPRALLLLPSLAVVCALGAFLPASAAAACPNFAVEHCQFAAGYAGTWQLQTAAIPLVG